ncbi:hypothetical protein SIN09_33960 [Streptomyces sp. F8]|uniref:hypothetical protein n=1 Tax=Streptomyces sp. F8 TaxID=1436085 RepID=UPI0029CFCA3C|nr:hypothetical protein [Streptomyces sp. F8]MDX6764265.1 hypothetical protein [Streptomyces sp. F8]
MTSALCALLLLAALAGPLCLRLRRHPAFVTGRDGRLSTSTAIALAWTVILVWLLLALLGYGLTAGGGVSWFHGTDGPLSTLTTVYLPLLGGPYVALIAAKTVVGLRVERGSLAKPAAPPTASGSRPLRELIANDSGRTDLVDLQYVTLSAVTMLYVVLFFLADVGEEEEDDVEHRDRAEGDVLEVDEVGASAVVRDELPQRAAARCGGRGGRFGEAAAFHAQADDRLGRDQRHVRAAEQRQVHRRQGGQRAVGAVEPAHAAARGEAVAQEGEQEPDQDHRPGQGDRGRGGEPAVAAGDEGGVAAQPQAERAGQRGQ